MGWMDKVKMISGAIVDTAVDFTASTLNVCGSVACVIGGVGFVAAQAVHATVNASYFGAATATGGLDVDGQLEHTPLGINYTLPLRVSGETEGEVSYKLTDYVDPNTVYIASAVLVSSGTALRALGCTLKKWQQRYDKAQYDTPLVKPSPREYLSVNIKSVSYSLSLSLLSYSLVSCIVNYSDLLGSKLQLTYPFVGEHHANGTYYHGSTDTGTYPVTIHLDPARIPLDLPIIGEVNLLLNMLVKGTAKVTYGGGLFFKPSVPDIVPSVLGVVSSTVCGISAFVAGSFFARKERHQRDERERAVHLNTVSSIQTEGTTRAESYETLYDV